MPTLCIPRRKSILIETIHHSRGPTDELLFLRSRRRAARTFMLGSLDRFWRVYLVVPLSTRFPLGFNFTGFRGISIERSVLVYLLARSVCPLSFLSFFLFRRPVELCAAGFASFRGIPAGLRQGARTFRPMT